MQIQSFTIRGQQFCLSAERCIFWEKRKTLIVSDLHLGKTGHFRKSGIAVPQSVYKEDLQRLLHLVQFFRAEEILVVGDLVHSVANKELDLFSKWRRDHEHLKIALIRGNHDILSSSWYEENHIDVHEGSYTVDEFCFQHAPNECEANTDDPFLFSGHIHPGIVLNGMGRQSLRFPCFYFSSHSCILPAFSRFTGAAAIEPKDGDIVFAIVNQSLVELKY
jgi:uncharacterized protein